MDSTRLGAVLAFQIIALSKPPGKAPQCRDRHLDSTIGLLGDYAWPGAHHQDLERSNGDRISQSAF
jgi:hypothetical protein